MQRNCLILGYGRAGKRHKINAEKEGLRVFTYDPNLQDVDFNTTYSIPWFLFDYAVIASPPEKHIEQINLLYENNVTRILCEKPLCDIAQNDFLSLSPDLSILVAYNWYYNQQVQELHGQHKDYKLFAEQTRILPEWGIVNDHVPHDLFIIDYIAKGITSIDHIEFNKSDKHQEVYIEGNTKSGYFSIMERVLTEETPRISKVNDVDLVPDKDMFDKMWDSFIRGKYLPSLKSAINIQKWLFEINSKLQKENENG